MWRLSVILLLALTADAQTSIGSNPDEALAKGKKLFLEKTPDSFRAALAQFKDALAGYERASNEPKQVDAQLAIATTQFALHDVAACQNTLREARQLATNAHDQLGQANAAAVYALVDDAQGDEPKAIEEASRTADLFHSLNKPQEEVQALFFLSNLYVKTNDQASLLATYERAFPVAAAAKNAQLEAFLSLRLGQLYNLRQEAESRKKAVTLLTSALPYFQNSSDKFDEAMTWWALGTAYDFLNNLSEGRDAYAHGVALAAATKSESVRGRLFRSLGHDELHLKTWSDASLHLQQAIALLTAPTDQTDRALAETELGDARLALNDTAGALNAYRSAVDDSDHSEVNSMAATAWLKIAAVHEKSFKWREATEASKNADSEARKPGGNSMLPAALQSLASNYLNAGQHKESLDIDKELLPLLHGTEKINVLIEAGINCSWLARYSEALHYLDDGLSESSPNTAERAGILAVLAEVHTSLNQLQPALREAEQSRDVYASLHIPNGEAKALNQLGLIYQSIGDKAKSETALNAALNSEHANNNEWGECATLNNLGDLQRFFGDYRKAEPLYQQALRVVRRIGDRYREASILHNLGLAEHGLGHETDALTDLESALQIRRELHDQDDEAKVLSAIGLIRLDTGEPEKGLDLLVQSFNLLHGTEDVDGEATVLDNIGTAYRALGDYIDAENYLKQADELDKKSSLDSSRTNVLNNLATVELTQALQTGSSPDYKIAHLELANGYYAQALPLAQKTANKTGQANILNSQAAIASEQGNQQHALALLHQAMALATETGSPDLQALVEHTTATVYNKLNNSRAAIEHCQRALSLWRKIGAIEGEEQTLFVVAKAERKLGSLEQSLQHIRTAVELAGTVRGRVGSDMNRATLSATTAAYYEFEIDLLMQLAKLHPNSGFETQAFEAAENGRSRSLLDLLAEVHADIRQGIDPALLAEEQRIERSLAAAEALRRKVAQPPGEGELVNQIAQLTSEYDSIEAQIRAKSPAYAAITHPQPLTLKEIQREVLDSDTVLLEFSLGEERSYLWAVTADSLIAHELPARGKIEDQAGTLNEHILARDPIEGESTSLSNLLLAPAVKELKSRIVIVSDGELQRSVPFAVLPEPGVPNPQPLIVRHEIVTEASASTLAFVRRNRRDRTSPPKLLAVVADPVFGSDDERLKNLNLQSTDSSASDVSHPLPRLTETATEAKSILELGKPTQELAMIGFDANKDAILKARLADYRIVHFATHAFPNSEHPSLSVLALSTYDRQGHSIDGFLTLNDIYNLHLPVDLVVLSACESGQGRLVRGEGIVGLTRGFMYAGAGSLVVSLWKVRDESTAEFMRRFYKSYLGDRSSGPAAALRKAQLSFLQDRQWNNAYFWAAFTLQGDWR